MRKTRQIMGMPIMVEICGLVKDQVFDDIFSYFHHVDSVFSTYKKDSEITRYNNGQLKYSDLSREVQDVLNLGEKTKMETHGYFDMTTESGIDPSGIVKGWAIQNASERLKNESYTDFLIDAGGDIATSGKNSKKKEWTIGIRNPFDDTKIIKIIAPLGHGVATSGTYQRGNHIYNPYKRDTALSDIKSITVLGPTVYDADRFATAAFAMGKNGITFIENLLGYEGYMIDSRKIATMTSGFSKYVI